MTRENSGLIDLDALMREAAAREAAGEPPPTPLPEPSLVHAAGNRERDTLVPPSRAVRVNVGIVPLPAPSVGTNIEASELPTEKVLPTALSSSKVSDDSLEAVTSSADTDPWLASANPPTTPPAPSRSIQRSSLGRRPAVAMTLALALLAGGAAFLRMRAPAVDPQAAATSIEPPSRVDTPTAAAAPPTEAATVAALSAEDLPTAAAPSTSAHAALHHAVPGGPIDPAKPAATLTEAALAPSVPAGQGDLGRAMRGAVGANDMPVPVTSDEPSGQSAAQLHPSPGAVVGALGSVLPSARACLSPDDPIRSGLVVFKSDGTVARVDLRGSKPEDDCVRSALSKAKVAPFVDDTFSTRVTVRP